VTGYKVVERFQLCTTGIKRALPERKYFLVAAWLLHCDATQSAFHLLHTILNKLLDRQSPASGFNKARNFSV